MLTYIMGVLEQRKLERPLVTASMVKGRTSLEITESGKIPEIYLTLTEDKAAITKALKDGLEVPGAELRTGADFLKLTTV